MTNPLRVKHALTVLVQAKQISIVIEKWSQLVKKSVISLNI